MFFFIFCLLAQNQNYNFLSNIFFKRNLSVEDRKQFITEVPNSRSQFFIFYGSTPGCPK